MRAISGTVSVDVDDNVPAVPADQIGFVVGQYARTYIASGSLVVQPVLQGAPLVSPGRSVVAIEVRPTNVPSGLRERSQVLLVIDNGEDEPPTTVGGRVVARPTGESSSSGRVAISVELAAADAPTVALAEEIGVILLDPGVDPATEPFTEPGVEPTAATSVPAPTTAPPGDAEDDG